MPVYPAFIKQQINIKHQKRFIFIHQFVSLLIIVNTAFGYFTSFLFLNE